MTKEDLRAQLKALDPENKAVHDSRATTAILNREIVNAKNKAALAAAMNAAPVTVKYRKEDVEDSDVFSWRCFKKDVAVTALEVSGKLPAVNVIVAGLNGEPYKIVDVQSGLQITAGDLRYRESFDPRRIYLTKRQSAVTFKREQDGMIVVWSYEHMAEIAVGPNQTLTRTDRIATAVAARNSRPTQKLLAAYIISQNPSVTGAELTDILREAFPQCEIAARHGPHYLSLSRNGRLPEPPTTDPRTWK